MVDAFTFLRNATKGTPKVTMPAPSELHFFGGRDVIDLAPIPTSTNCGPISSPSIARKSPILPRPAAPISSSTIVRSRCFATRNSSPRFKAMARTRRS